MGTGALARIAGAMALLAIAIVLGLLGRDVLAWRGQTGRAAVGIAALSPDLGIWEPDTWLPARASRALLGAGDDIELGRALQAFQILRAGGEAPFYRSTRRAALAQTELDLDRLASSADRPRARSQARTLHALLLYEQLRQQPTEDPVQTVQRVDEELRKAVRTDPTNAVAKYDLDAILRVLTPLLTPRVLGELPEKGAKSGSRAGGGGSGGTVNTGGGF